MSFAPATPRSHAGARRRGAAAGQLSVVLLFSAFAHSALAGDAVPDWTQIGALFHERCVMCHAREAAARGLRLDSYAGVIAGSENGLVLIPGDASSSELFRRLLGESRPRMPFLSRSLTPEEIALIERWIAAGLPERAPPTLDAVLD